MKRLDKHNDNYRNASLSYNMNFQARRRIFYNVINLIVYLIIRLINQQVPVKQEPGLEATMSVTAHLSQLLQQKKANKSASQAASNEKGEGTTGKPAVKRKVKHEKTERDRNAPKRPANPFLLFCQDKRAFMLEKMQKESKVSQTKCIVTLMRVTH